VLHRNVYTICVRKKKCKYRYNKIYIYFYIINLRIYLNMINNKNGDYLLVLMWNCEICVITRYRLTRFKNKSDFEISYLNFINPNLKCIIELLN